jgi:hypothetical protein
MKIRYGLWADAGHPPSVEEFNVTVDFGAKNLPPFPPSAVTAYPADG